MSAFASRKRAWEGYSGPAAAAWNAKRRRSVAVKKRILRPLPAATLRRMVSPELKYFDTTLSFSVDATGEVPATGQLCLIPQGTGESARVGRVVRVKSLQIRALCQYNPGAAALASTNMYLYVVLDTQCNGAAAAVTDVLTSNNFAVALNELDNSARFRVLRRIKVNFTAAAGVTTAFNSTVKTIDHYQKLNIPLDFSSTTGAITEIRSNNIFLMCGSDTTSDDLIAVNGTARLRYTDQ